MKKEFSCLLLLLLLLSLTACGGKAEPEPVETEYILTNYTALPDSITGVTRCVLDGDRLLLCCREEEDRENIVTYAAAIHTDGSGFEKLPLSLEGAEKLLDLTPDGQGGLWCVCMTPTGEDTVSCSLRRFDSRGYQIAETLLDELLEEQDALSPYSANYYPYYANNCLVSDGDGNLCLSIRNGRTSCFFFNPEGDFLFSLQDPKNTKTVIRTPSGQLAFCATGDGDATYSVLPLDMKNHRLDEGPNIGSIATAYSGNGDTDFYFYNFADFYRYSLETGTVEKLFRWSNLGLASGDAHVCPLGDGRFAVVAGTFNQTQLMTYEFCLVEPGVDERTVLTMLSLQPENSLLEAIAQFNKSSSEYKVELSSCFSMNEDVSREDWANAITRLNTELISGKIPDLLDLEHMPADAYSRRGLLEDLYPYLQNDPSIHMEDYFANVFDALSVHGKLPYVTSNVSIRTMFADANAVGSERGWTVEEFAALKASRAVEMDILYPGEYLRRILSAENPFVDWETGECRFDSEEFIRLLEHLRSQFHSDTEISNEDLIFEGEPNCIEASLLMVFDPAFYNAQFAGNANPIGYPSTTGEVIHFLEPSNKIGFSTACQHKDGAWAFVRSFLEPKLQESGRYFPFYKPSFEKIFAAAAKGNTMWRGGAMFDRLEIDEESIALAREILSTAKYCDNSDTDLIDMIIDLTHFYFNATKTAQEVASEVQSRAQLYVGEHM